MKKLDQALDKLKFDTRMVDFNLQNGIISQNELDQHLNGLSDVSAQGESLEIEEETTSNSSGSQNDTPLI